MKLRLTLLFIFIYTLVRGADTVTVNGYLITAPTNLINKGYLVVSNGVTVRVNYSNNPPFTVWMPFNANTNGFQVLDYNSNVVFNVTTSGISVLGSITGGVVYGGGESNVLANAGPTNASSNISLVGPKYGITNTLMTLGAGSNIILTNEGGTNLMIASTASGGAGGSATNAIGFLNGFGTNTSLYGWTYFFGPITNTGATELQGAVTNGASLNVAGPLSVYSAHTNRSTVRNMAGVTNDVNVHTTGAATNVSTVDIAGSLNTFSANTNWSTVRNKANVTNDAVLHQAGAQTNQSVLDVTGPLVAHGATTNRSTTRHIGNVTNDAIVHVTGNQTNVATLDVAGSLVAHSAATNRSTLRVIGGQTNDSNLQVAGAVVAQSTANITGATAVGGTLTASNAIIGQGTMNITSSANIGGILTVSNTLAAQVAANITGQLGVGGTLVASNAVNITGASTFGGQATFTNNIVGQSAENLTGALNVGGAIVASNTLNVTGASAHGGNATFTNFILGLSGENITGALNVGGATILSNTLAIQGTTTNSGAINNAGVVTNWVSTTHKGGVSNELWQTTAGTATNLGDTYLKSLPGNSPIWMDVSGKTTNMIQNWMPRGLPWLSQRLSTNGLIQVIPIGDSVMGTAQLYAPIYSWLSNYYGFGGALGSGGGSALNPGVVAPAYATNSDFTTWYSSHWVLPNSGILNVSNVLSGSIVGNIYEVDYVASNGFGGFTIATNINGGSFSTIATLSANLGAGLGPTGLVYRFTNTAAVATQMRITCISNTVKIVGVGILNSGSSGGVVFNDFAYPGLDMGQFCTVPTNIMGPILRSWNPQLVFLKWMDSSTIFSNNFGLFNSFFNTYLTNTDVIWIGSNPIETSDIEVQMQNRMAFTNCVAQGWGYFDGYSIYGSFQNGLNAGFLASGGNVHPTTAGDAYCRDQLAKLLNLFNSGSRTPINGPAQPVWAGGSYGTTGSLSLTGNVTLVGSSTFDGGINFLNSGANLWLDIDTSGGFQKTFRFRQHGGGTDMLRLRDNGAGIISLIPGGTVGVPYNIGSITANEGWLNIVGSNLTAETTFTNLGSTYLKGSPVNSYLITDGNGKVTSLLGSSNDIVRDYYAGIPNTTIQIATNGTMMLFPMGDSMMGADPIAQEQFTYFINNYGFAGALGQGTASYLNPAPVAPGYQTNSDFTTWYTAHWVLPNTGILNVSNVMSGSITGNVYEVDYVASNGFGGFTVATNINGGSFTTIATLSANLGAGLGPTGLVYRFTNTASLPTQMRITCISNTVKIVGVGIMNIGTNGGVIINDFSYSGLDIGNFTSVPTNIMGPILRSWKPHLILYKATDSASVMQTSLPLFNQFMDAYLTNSDKVWISMNPIAVNNADVLAQNLIAFTNAINKGWSFMDGYTRFVSYDQALNKGLITAATSPHLTASGADFESDEVAKFLNLFNTANRFFGNSYGFPYYSRNADFSITGNLLMRGSGTFSGGFNFINGTANMWQDIDTTAGQRTFRWREHGGGYDMARLRGVSGVVSFIAGDASSGATYNIGGTAAGEAWRNVWSTNTTTFGTQTNQPSTTTTIAQQINLPGGHNTNAVSILLGPANVGGFQSNGPAFLQISNATTVYPASYTVFVMTANGANTNTTTTTNSWWGTGVGSRTLPANFWQVGRRLDIEMEGDWWVGATPGNTRIMAMLNTSTATNIAAQVLAAAPASVTAGDFFRTKISMTCRTTGGSGTIATSGCIEWYKAGADTTFAYTNTVLTIDTGVAQTCDIMSTNGSSTYSVQPKNGSMSLR